MTKTTEFDISQYLDDKEIIAEYLTQLLKDGDMEELLQAVGNIAKAKGMSQISKRHRVRKRKPIQNLSSRCKTKI